MSERTRSDKMGKKGAGSEKRSRYWETAAHVFDRVGVVGEGGTGGAWRTLVYKLVKKFFKSIFILTPNIVS